ncbi:MAG: bifunctional sulfate adenylyltransferase/adenylylsulfate kinase [Planctomycetes bacterium]|nr:bifunctional sulfate adenylyltransferase/adenylylsulfate kinase [Planctomycetota bacterium]
MPSHLIQPYGGTLVDLIADEDRAKELRELSREWPSWDLTPRQICDVELLLNGGFSPLRGFMSQEDYEGVCQDMRLADGTLWPVPIVLDVPEETAKELEPDDMLALRNPEGVMLAAMKVTDVWQPDIQEEAQSVYGTTSPEHPGVAHLMQNTHPWYVGGRLEGVELPRHYDFRALRLTPQQLRQRFANMGWRRVVAFQTRNPMHRAHRELTFRAAKDLEANLLIHPVVGVTKPGDVDHYTRVRCYQAILKRYPHNTAFLSLLPLAMRMAGPREAIWHAIIRRNYGCTHLIVGRDHAGPGENESGQPFYGPYESQELVRQHEEELGIQMVPFKMLVYLQERDEYVPLDEVPDGMKAKAFSGTELRERLAKGAGIPEWFSFPEVIRELRRTYPPRNRHGFTVFFTGLPSAGKSTLANVLLIRLLEAGGRPVTLLDGDIVRTHLSSELGFSKEHRDLNILRIGFVASEITKNGGIALCAPIAPYDNVRKQVRQMIEPVGGFILVHVATPLETCERRDRKGLYAKARAGIIKDFTGISDPYERPADAEIVIDTTSETPEECVQEIILYLEKEGYIGPES